MNEELQSTNEELEGVNQELRDRGFELGRSNVFLSGILRSVPYAVVVLNREFQVELWNETAADLWGVRQDEARGKHFFALDIGLPLERLGPTLNAVLNDSDRPVTLAVDGTNRRGKPIRVKMLLATVGGTPEVGKGIIILMDSSELTAQS